MRGWGEVYHQGSVVVRLAVALRDSVIRQSWRLPKPEDQKEPQSKLLVSPLITLLTLPYMIP